MWLDRTPAIRDFPFPFSALLAISSDLDGTKSWSDYFHLIRFMNTTEDTELGPGVELEFANSIYFHALPGEFSYWSAAQSERAGLQRLIHSGYVDTLHSFGDLACQTSSVAQSLLEMTHAEYHFPVWIDHARAITNLGIHQTRGCGDVPGHPVYHVAELVRHGLTHCWRGQVTSAIGQRFPSRLLPSCNMLRNSPSQWITSVKEASKIALASMGSNRYSLHFSNRILSRITLRDGCHLYEFLRCNPSHRGVSRDTDAATLRNALPETALRSLVERRGAMILYTHLGRRMPRTAVARREFRETLARVAEAYRGRQLLVMTTSRMLDYLAVRDHCVVKMAKKDGGAYISVEAQTNDDLTRRALLRNGAEGLTFKFSEPCGVEIIVNGSRVLNLEFGKETQDGTRTVTIPLKRKRSL